MIAFTEPPISKGLSSPLGSRLARPSGTESCPWWDHASQGVCQLHRRFALSLHYCCFILAVQFAPNAAGAVSYPFSDNMEVSGNWTFDPLWNPTTEATAHSGVRSNTDSPGTPYQNNVNASATLATALDPTASNDVVKDPVVIPIDFRVATDAEERQAVPTRFSLLQAGTSPCGRQTAFFYELSLSCRVTLAIFDAAGRRVAVLVDAMEGPG